MSLKVYGKRIGATYIPEFYDQSTVLEIKRSGDKCAIAWGSWFKRDDMKYPVFRLDSGSYIAVDDKFEGEPDIKSIKKELLEGGFLLDTGEGFYEVLQTIYFHYPSTAGKLVQGYHSNGYIDWKTENGTNLDDLLILRR